MANFLEIASSGDYLEFTFNDYATVAEKPDVIHKARKHKSVITDLVFMEDAQGLEFIRVRIGDKDRRVVYDDGEITLQQSLAQKTLVVKTVDTVAPTSNEDLYVLIGTALNTTV